ncbi:MAG: hypothetical protein AAF770_03075 [Bacteroidota bacterium]
MENKTILFYITLLLFGFIPYHASSFQLKVANEKSTVLLGVALGISSTILLKRRLAARKKKALTVKRKGKKKKTSENSLLAKQNKEAHKSEVTPLLATTPKEKKQIAEYGVKSITMPLTSTQSNLIEKEEANKKQATSTLWLITLLVMMLLGSLAIIFYFRKKNSSPK